MQHFAGPLAELPAISLAATELFQKGCQKSGVFDIPFCHVTNPVHMVRVAVSP